MGSAPAVSDVYEEALPVVYGYLRRRCASDELAEDLTATTFVRAATACSRGQLDEPTIPWLMTTARNLLIDHWRHRAVVERTASLIEAKVPPEDPWHDVLNAARAEELLAELKPEHRCALTLRYLDDLSVAEVADLMQRSVHATESLLVRARAALRRSYDRTGGAQ